MRKCLQPLPQMAGRWFLDNIFHVLSLEAELNELSLDGSIVQAHQHSAGAKKGGLKLK